MPPDFHIRTARRADVPNLQRLMGELAAQSGDVSRVAEADFEQACFGRKKLSHAFLATDTAGACGFALCRPWHNLYNGARLCHIDFLFVTETARHQGMGTALLQSVAEYARHSGCSGLALEVAAKNAAAHHLYRRFGFTVYPGKTQKMRCPLL